MQQFKLEELLRYGFAGAVGLTTLLLAFSGLSAYAANVPAVTQTSVLVAAAFSLGTLVYAVHRAFLYPLIYRIVLVLLAICGVYRFDKRFFLLLSPVPLEVQLDFLRWKRTKEDDYAQPRLGEWGAQVHFLYCSSWAVILVLYLGGCIPLTPTSSNHVLWRGSELILAAAFVSNCRLAYYDSCLARRDRPELGRPSKNTEIGHSKAAGHTE